MPPTLDLLLQDTTLVLVADQAPFAVDSKGFTDHFCLLQPLMTIDGQALPEPEALFPSRGRVWWMLSREMEVSAVRPGMVYTAQLERAPKTDKDTYQARRASVAAGAKDWVEVLDVEDDVPDIGRLCGGAGIRCDRPPMPRVVVRGRTHAIGPLKSAFDPEAGRLTLSAVNLGKPVTWRLPREQLGEVREFEVQLNRHERARVAVRTVRVALLPERQVERLEKEGEPFDAGTDAQIVKWGLGLAHYTNRQKSEFRDALEALPDPALAEAGEFPGRLERFRRLCADAERVRGLGVEIAGLLGQQPFRDLVETHVGAVAKAQVEAAVKAREAEIAERLAALEERKAQLEAQVAEGEAAWSQRQAELEQRLEAEQHDRLEALAARERAVAEREQAILAREREAQQRLERVLAEYENAAGRVADQILTQLPVLRRLGLGPAAARPAEPPPAELQWPPALQRAVERTELGEADFLAQLAAVVESRGYVFARDDLANFHVAVKAGLWTVVAGPTGIGKSSLPRLYAEALGMGEEFLAIPVQPDWLDDRDVIGAFNALAGRFEPAATGLVDRLIQAQEDLARDRGGIYLICLDEMNLSRVEHYFARFLSVLELPAAQRRIPLFGAGVATPDDPYARRRELCLGDNVRFVGTVNIDETTHFFSPKVLDRSALLMLDAPDLGKDARARVRATRAEIRPIALPLYRSWIRGPEQAPEPLRRLLLELDQHLRKVRSGLGYRLRDRILTHVASAHELLAPERAFDLAFAQTVLPRIRTHEDGADEVLQKLLELVPAARFPRSGHLLALLRAAEGRHDFFQLL